MGSDLCSGLCLTPGQDKILCYPSFLLIYGRTPMPNEKTALHLGLGYLYVVIAVTSAVFSGFMFRDVYRFTLIRAELHRYTIHVNVLFLTVIVGLICLVLLVFLEHYFRNAENKRIQFIRMLKVLAFPLFLAAVAHLMHWGLAFWGAQYFDFFRFVAACLELILGVGLLIATNRRLGGAQV